jgi:DNA-directed RNA polymerase specialized sigma24 family protein
VTVQGEAPAAPDVDLGAAAQQMTEIFNLYWDRLRVFIWKRIDIHQQHLAEDLASETFAELWRRYFLTGRGGSVDKPYGLLCTMARSQIGQHFLRKGSTERALDFTDPVNTPLIATGHAYALEAPGLNHLLAELDAAMDRMTEASKTWRAKHKDSHQLRSLLKDGYNASRGGLTAEGKRDLKARLDVVDREETEALHAFRGTCRRVGQLRAEMEATAGPNWRSSTGLPLNPEITSPRPGKYRNDLTVTHCPAGHLMDLHNTHFGEDGSRDCRACRNARHQARQNIAAKHQASSTVTAETIDAARKMLADPSNAGLSIKAIAAAVGTSSTTLHTRIPDLASLRRTAKEKAAALTGAAR